jgi:3-phenylpropionate/trans-cinnamate dioxygenase ferredoxin reductase subunit
VVIGGGFIGLEVAASARKLGKDVTFVLLDRRLMARAVGQRISDFFLAAHTRRGIAVHFGVTPSTFLHDGRDRVAGVVLDDGTSLSADLVVIGIGVSPRTDLAVQLGLTVDNGIVVDEYMQCSDGTTVAAEDFVSCPDPMGISPARVRFESVNTVIEQAKTAAATIAGAPEPYRTPSWFWSDQFDLKLQVTDLSAEHDRIVLRGSPAAKRFSVLYYRAGSLIAGECVHAPADFLSIRSALAARRSIPPDTVTETSVPLKQILRDQADAAMAVDPA